MDINGASAIVTGGASGIGAASARRLAAKGAMLHSAITDCASVLGLGPASPDAAITLSRHHLLLRPMPGRPRAALHLLIDRQHGDIGVARAQLQQIDQALLGNSA